MAPPAIVDKPETSRFAEASPIIEILPLQARAPKPWSSQINVPVRVQGIFKSALIEHNRMKHGSHTLDAVISVILHVTIIAVPILASLYFTDTINLKQFTATILVAPPPPPPPPPPANTVVKAARVHRVFVGGKLMAPRYVPNKVAVIREAPLPEDADMNGVVGGVPGGVPGGQMGGVIGGVIGGVGVLGKPVVPPAPINKPKAPIRVGGHIRAPRALVQPPPIYPILAKQIHLSGKVVIDTIIDEQGNVVDMKVVNGPPLLYAAALEALRHWKYEPTYLNDTPIPVQMIVTITFQLSDTR